VAPRVGTGEVKLLVLLTKADKLSRAEGARAAAAAQAALGELTTEHADVGLCLFSALNKTGLDDVALALREWVLSTPVIDMPAGFEAPADASEADDVDQPE